MPRLKNGRCFLLAVCCAFRVNGVNAEQLKGSDRAKTELPEAALAKSDVSQLEPSTSPQSAVSLFEPEIVSAKHNTNQLELSTSPRSDKCHFELTSESTKHNATGLELSTSPKSDVSQFELKSESPKSGASQSQLTPSPKSDVFQFEVKSAPEPRASESDHPELERHSSDVVTDLPVKYWGNSFSLKFHRPSCPFALAMEKQHIIFFNFRRQAIESGQKPCRYCLPPFWKSVRAAVLHPEQLNAKGSNKSPMTSN